MSLILAFLLVPTLAKIFMTRSGVVTVLMRLVIILVKYIHKLSVILWRQHSAIKSQTANCHSELSVWSLLCEVFHSLEYGCQKIYSRCLCERKMAAESEEFIKV